MERINSNGSDIFSKYLSPLEEKGEPSKEKIRKRTLPPTLPGKQLAKIDEQPNIALNGEPVDGNEYFGKPKTLSNIGQRKNEDDTIHDDPADFDPRKFNANYDGTIKDPHYKAIVPGNGNELEGSPNFNRRQFPPTASGPTAKHDLGFSENNNRTSTRSLSARISSLRDIVEIRKRINDQVNPRKDGTFNRYIYLDRGNTWCLRITLFICIITIIILFILVSHNANRLSALEGT